MDEDEDISTTNGKPASSRLDGANNPTIKSALCYDAYDKIALRAPSNVKERHTMRVAAVPRESLADAGPHAWGSQLTT